MCLFLALTTLLTACGLRKEKFPEAPAKGSYSEEKPLMAVVESEEQARELAELYGITLVEFNDPVATYYTEEDLQKVIQRGEENGWPLLEINYFNAVD